MYVYTHTCDRFGDCLITIATDSHLPEESFDLVSGHAYALLDVQEGIHHLLYLYTFEYPGPGVEILLLA